VCVCRAPSADFDQFLNLCDLTLKYLHNLHTELVIHGDFDISLLKDSIFNQQITLLFQIYNLSTNFPTRTGEVSRVLASVALH
jgi:hypothetical protein